MSGSIPEGPAAPAPAAGGALVNLAGPLGDVRVGQQVTLPAAPGQQRGSVISAQEFLILLDGEGGGRFATMRDVAIGVFASSVFGAISLSVTAVKHEGFLLVSEIVSWSVTGASLFLIWFFNSQAGKEKARQSYVHCCARIRVELGLPESAAKPKP